MNNKIVLKRILIIALPFIFIPLIFFVGKILIDNISVPPCFYYKTLHIYCPGCGFTRAVEALFRGEILLSIRQNFLAVFLILLGALYYIEALLNAFNINFRIKPLHNIYSLYIFIAFDIAFDILRNFVPALAPIFL